jgi:hypothetical protein
VRFGGGTSIRLHAAWDNMLGESASLPCIEETVAEVQRLEQTEVDAIHRDLVAHPTSADWARESFASAQQHAYLNGDLAPPNSDSNPSDDIVPNLSEAYKKNANQVARLAVAKSSQRLANCIARALK